MLADAVAIVAIVLAETLAGVAGAPTGSVQVQITGVIDALSGAVIFGVARANSTARRLSTLAWVFSFAALLPPSSSQAAAATIITAVLSPGSIASSAFGSSLVVDLTVRASSNVLLSSVTSASVVAPSLAQVPPVSMGAGGGGDIALLAGAVGGALFVIGILAALIVWRVRAARARPKPAAGSASKAKAIGDTDEGSRAAREGKNEASDGGTSDSGDGKGAGAGASAAASSALSVILKEDDQGGGGGGGGDSVVSVGDDAGGTSIAGLAAAGISSARSATLPPAALSPPPALNAGQLLPGEVVSEAEDALFGSLSPVSLPPAAAAVASSAAASVASAASAAAAALGPAVGGVAAALELAAPAVPIIGVALSAIAALLRQVEAMRASAEASRHLAARLERLRSLTRRSGEDAAFVAEHAGIFEGLVATLRRAEKALARINERSRLASFVLSSGDVERIAAVDKALTLHVAELSAALQAETLSAVRGLHAAASARDAGLGAAIAEAMQQQQLQSSLPSLLRSPSLDEALRPTLPPFNMTFRLADLLFDPPLEVQERTAPRGSFGIVVFATWREHALPCAVKMIPARTALGAQALSFMAWMGEAELMRRLREHRAADDVAVAGDRGRRHVVNIFGIGVHEDAKSGEPERCK